MESPRLKESIRIEALARRRAQANKDDLSRLICERFAALDEFAPATTVMIYVDTRSEVRTRRHLPSLLTSGKRIVVPYAADDRLQLFVLHDANELAPGKYAILEPKPQLRVDPTRQVTVEELDLVMVPGVAFDPRGVRLGYGWGYYDKLLAHVRPDATLAALAFECQIFPEIPAQEHDILMDKIITERAVCVGQRKK